MVRVDPGTDTAGVGEAPGAPGPDPRPEAARETADQGVSSGAYIGPQTFKTPPNLKFLMETRG